MAESKQTLFTAVASQHKRPVNLLHGQFSDRNKCLSQQNHPKFVVFAYNRSPFY